MTRTKGLAIAFYVGAVVAGATIGIAVDRAVYRERLEERMRDPNAWREDFARELGLDATQRSAMDSIIDARDQSMEAVWAPMRPQFDSLRNDARARIRQLLTPEQQAKYDEMQRAREAARRGERR